MPPSPKRKPGPKSKTKLGADRPSALIFRCTYCGRVFTDRRELVNHKKTDHADQITHITESSVTGVPAAGRGGFAVPEDPPASGRRKRGRPRGAPNPPDSPDHSSDDEENDPPPRSRSRSSSPPSPPSPPKRGKKQGRNKGPLPIGRKKKVRGEDGVEREEYNRNPKENGG